MGSLKDIKIKRYLKIKQKYPNAEYIYSVYKLQNMEFHNSHKFTSWKYLSRLISAEKKSHDLTKVDFPKNTYNPFLSGSCTSKNQKGDKKCLALPDHQLIPRKEPLELANELGAFDVISFDIFDTCIFRPFAKPTDAFYLLEAQNGIIGFAELRKTAEQSAREKTSKPNFEIDIYDIYEDLATRCFIKKEDAEKEIALEKQICYANPYMLEVFKLLKKKKKKLVATSDMYLPSNVIKEILEKNGFVGFDKIFVSNEHGYSKNDGKLYDIVKENYPSASSFAHVGDNEFSDIKKAQINGFVPFYYENCNNFGNEFRRPISLTSPSSSMYKSIANNYIYNGTCTDSARECFGFLYAGPIVVGYTEWINQFVKNNNLEKIFFSARDMNIFYKIYNKHFKVYENEYVAVSRFALQEFLYEDFPDEVVNYTIKPRCDKGYTIKQTLEELNLNFLSEKLKNYDLNEKSYLLGSNVKNLIKLIKDEKSAIAKHFENNEKAAINYFKEKLNGARRICVADIGWRGSVLVYLKYLLVDKWKLCDEVKGLLLGCTESESSRHFMAQGLITPYAYSYIHNRDLTQRDGAKEFISVMVLEAIFTSTENSLLEYSYDPKTQKTKFVTLENNPNNDIINEFHFGITKFVDEFEKHRKPFEKLLPYSAVDAFEPLKLILDCNDYVSFIIGDVLDTPNQLAGLGIKIKDYVPLGNIMVQRGYIQKW